MRWLEEFGCRQRKRFPLTRSSFITCWPSNISSETSDEIVCILDFATSFTAIAGTPVPDNACLDSFNILPALLGEKGAKGRAELIQQDNGKKGAAADFAYALAIGNSCAAAQNIPPRPRFPSAPSHNVRPNSLDFLPDDPAERKNLSKENLEKTTKLIKRLDVNEAFVGARERFTERRKDGARKMRGSGAAAKGVLWSIRDLRVRV